ncbi:MULTISPECIES: hypothetical protein [Leptospira]|uniref:hypothetical protein n=1 Tax=Leptospira TaxID=171 RepID=UPI000A5261B7|nr:MULTISPECIES: hypothetical protein [Leptospira]
MASFEIENKIVDKFISSPYCKNKKLPKNMSSKLNRSWNFFIIISKVKSCLVYTKIGILFWIL